jgi:hypothetical protein
MSRIEANPQVQQELQSRGVTDAVGVFGNHQVKIGEGDPVRLDRIRSAPIPFAGFREATKIERGMTGVNQAGGDALRQLARPGGRLDAGKLLGDFKALRAQLNRLGHLGQLIPPAADAILRAYAPLVQNLSNEDLSAVFQAFTSAEMDLLQTGLRHEGGQGSVDARKMTSDLADIQALVTKEISNRIGRDMNLPEDLRGSAVTSLAESFGPLCRTGAAPAAPDAAAPSGPHIASTNLLTLAETGARGATARERMDFDRQVAVHSLQPQPSLSARAIGDIMRNAPLTMNIDAQFLFGDSSILTQPEAQVQNYYHLAREAQEGNRAAESLPGGMGYVAPRDAVEHLLFPELGEHGVDNPNARPTYAALNIDHNELGAASSGYGGAHIVFKPEVAQRATYAAEDTFYAIPASFTPERRENFYNRLMALHEDVGLSLNFVGDICNPASELHRAFEAFFDDIATNPDVTIGSLDAPPEGIIRNSLNAACAAAGINERDGANYMCGALIASFGDSEKARARTATYDSLETLLPGMATPTFNSLARAALERSSIVGLMGTRYIEAQIQGGIVPGRDIAEIRVDMNDIPSRDLPAARERAEAFTRNTGIPVTFFDSGDRVYEGHQDGVSSAKAASQDFNAAGHWNQDRLADNIGAIRGNPQIAIDHLLANPGAGLRDLPAGVRNLRGNALAQALNKTEELAQEWARNTPAGHSGWNSENALVVEAFGAVAAPLLREKAALLTELDTLRFDNAAQKDAFVNWVMSARALSSPDELRVVHANATRQAEALRAIAEADPPLSPEATMQRCAETLRQGKDELDAFIQRMQENGGVFGAEDKATEISRIAFMAIALLRNTEGGAEALETLANRMTSSEQLALAGQMLRLDNEVGALTNLNTEGEHVNEAELFARTNLLMDMTRYSLCEATGRYPPRVPPFIGELSLLPSSTRAAFHDIAPTAAAELERTHPAYPSFPAPANSNALPRNEADRRQFLVDLLHPGGTYVAHETTFELGRSTHGRGHIARAWIFAETMCNILGEMGVGVDRNAVLCGIAGHDMGRQGGGQDRWEGRSAEMLTEGAMSTAFGARNLGETYLREIGRSIDAHGSQTLEGLLLNAADSLDIGRTATFDPEHFAFLHGGAGEVPTREAKTMRAQLAREADLLQRLTDPLCQARPAIDHLYQEMQDAPPHYEDALMTQIRDIRQGVADAYARRWSESGEDFMQSVESAVRLNPDMFPLLAKYYAQPMAQAGEPSLPPAAERINADLPQTAQAITNLASARTAAEIAVQAAATAATAAAAANGNPAVAASAQTAAQAAAERAATAQEAVGRAAAARTAMAQALMQNDSQALADAARTVSDEMRIAQEAAAMAREASASAMRMARAA